MRHSLLAALVSFPLLLSAAATHGQSIPGDHLCGPDAAASPPFCSAVRGDRAEGWLRRAAPRSWRARHGRHQPAAGAQAGLEILRKGGNAVDAAVATAAVLNLVEPMNVGVAGDLFAIIYTAKEHKLHVLNASGMAPSGATVDPS